MGKIGTKQAMAVRMLLEAQEWATSSMSVERLLLTTQGQ